MASFLPVFTLLMVVFTLVPTVQSVVDIQLPPNIDQETYCELCKTAASALHKDINQKKKTLYEAWDNLCSRQTFSSMKKKHNIEHLINGCKYLQQPSHAGSYEMYEMVRQMVEHDGSEVEIKSSMCHMTSDACRGLQKKISDVDGPVDLSVEDIQKYLDINNVRKPDPVRPKPTEHVIKPEINSLKEEL